MTGSRLVGRNGVQDHPHEVLAGLGQPAGGWVSRSEDVGYLAQDPGLRIPSSRFGRGFCRPAACRTSNFGCARPKAMASADRQTRDKTMRRYANAEAEYIAVKRVRRSRRGGGGRERTWYRRTECSMGGWAICPVGQRRRVELARLLFSEQSTLLLDEPTNHLGCWIRFLGLRGFLASHTGGLVIISHDVDLLAAVVNRLPSSMPTRAGSRSLQRRLGYVSEGPGDRREAPTPRARMRTRPRVHRPRRQTKMRKQRRRRRERPAEC